MSEPPRVPGRGWTPPGAGGCATASTWSGSTPCRPRCPPTAIACSSPRRSPWTACRRSRRWRCRRSTARVWCASPGVCRRRSPARCRSRCSDWSCSDLYGLLQRDTTGVHGELGVSMDIGGTTRDPTFRGTARLAEGRFGDFRSPFVLRACSTTPSGGSTPTSTSGARARTFWRSRPTCRWTSALTGVQQRRVEGPLQVRADADSVDLGLLEALTPAVHRVRGPPRGGRRRWTAPGSSRDSRARSRSGTAAWTCPDSASSSASVDGQAVLQGDSLLLRDVRITSGGGDLAIGGAVRLERPLAAAPRPRSPGRASSGDRRAQLPHPRGHRRPPAARPAPGRDPHRQPDRQQRRALLRRPGEQAGDRSGGPDHRRPGGHARSSSSENLRRQVPEPLPRFAADGGPAGGDRLRRLAALGRGQHPARRRGAGEQGGPGVSADRDAAGAAGELHPQDRPRHPRLHRDARRSALHRRP